MTRSKRGPNRTALEATIKAAPVLQSDRNAATVQLARTLADQVDAAGADVSSRVSAAYLSSLKDITRAIGAGGAGPTSSRQPLTVVPTEPTTTRSWRST